MIDIRAEELVPIADVPKLKTLPLRRNGKRLNVSTVWRWSQYGQRGVKLESIKLGGQRCTSLQALQRFFEALSKPSQTISPPLPTSTQLKRKEINVEAQLDQLGI